MFVSYTMTGRTPAGRPIRGHVMIDSAYDADSLGGLGYRIVAFEITDGSEVMCGCGDDAGRLVFMNGPTPDVVLTAGGLFTLGPWSNDQTGVWFGHADGTRYPGPNNTFGEKEAYEILAPRILLNGDQVDQGPFQPAGTLMLTMAPDGLESFVAAAPSPPPAPRPPGAPGTPHID